jgi:hypothetical protein
MGRLFALVLGVVVGGVAVYGSLEYHLVRTSDGFLAVPKTKANWADTYVDVRPFGVEDWARHRDLVEALIAAKKEQVFGEAAEGGMKEKFGALFRSRP